MLELHSHFNPAILFIFHPFSFIYPILIPDNNANKLENNITIHTTLNTFVVKPIFRELNEPGMFQFLQFKFHPNFNGLLGIHLLTNFKAQFYIANLSFQTTFTKLKITTQINQPFEAHTISPHTKMRVSLPVNISEGDFFCHTVRNNDNLTITGGLYTASNNTSSLSP